MAPITLISAVPTYISLEEHRNIVASTPASFTDIPPVLRHKEENVSITISPPVDGFSTEDGAHGTLHILESVLIFMSATGRGFQVEYPSITLHAISRAEAGPSIYCQLDEVPGADEEVPAEDDAASDLKELIVVPKDSAALEPIFEGLSYCASLHPDPASLSDDMDDAFVDESGFETFTGDGNEELSEVGRAALAHLESIIYNPFEKAHEDDADEEEADPDGNENADATDTNRQGI